MALGQEFMRSSRYRTEPGEDVSALTTEAAKYGAYLSSLDQYYAGLDFQKEQLAESARQFDEGHELDEERFGLEGEKFEFTKETFDETSELDWFKAQTDRIGTRDIGDYRDQSIQQGYAELDYKYDKLEQDKFKLSDQKDIATLEQSTSGSQTAGKIDYGKTATSGSLYSDYYNEDGSEKSWLDTYTQY